MSSAEGLRVRRKGGKRDRQGKCVDNMATRVKWEARRVGTVG